MNIPAASDPNNSPPSAHTTSLYLQWFKLEDTARFARLLSQLGQINDLFITLYGDLGSGKTTWVRLLLENLGFKGRVKSPTYAIVESYQLLIPAQCKSSDSSFTVSHFDFYRFQDENEWEEAGFREIFANPGLKVVEWPDKVRGLLPKADLEMHIQTQADDSRSIEVKAISTKGQELLLTLQKAERT